MTVQQIFASFPSMLKRDKRGHITKFATRQQPAPIRTYVLETVVYVRQYSKVRREFLH